MNLHGIHHVTAVTGHAAHNLTFYTEVLGLRLVKKTVNQDDLSAYHLFYGDEIGPPGPSLPSSTGLTRVRTALGSAPSRLSVCASPAPLSTIGSGASTPSGCRTRESRI